MKIKKLTLVVFIIFSSACTVVDTELLELVLEIKNQNEELLNEVKSLHAKSDSLINELKNSANKQEELMEQVTKLQGDLAKILTEIGKLNEQLTTQGADIDAIKSQMTILQEQYSTIITQLEQLQQLSTILSEIELLKGQLYELSGNQQELIGMVGQNQQDLQIIKDLLEFIKTQTESSQNQLSELTLQLGKQGADIKTLLEQYQEIEKQLEELVKLGQLLEEIQSLKAQLSDLNQKYDDVISGLGQNQEAITSLKSQVDALQVELNGKLEQIVGLLESLTQQESDTEAILAQIEELKARFEEIVNLLNELLNNSNDGGGQVVNCKISTITYGFFDGDRVYSATYSGQNLTELTSNVDKVVFTYDDQNHLTKREFFNIGNTQVQHKSEFTTNSNGLVIETRYWDTYQGNLVYVGKHSFTYNGNKLRVLTDYRDDDTSISGKLILEWTGDNPTKLFVLDHNDVLECENIFTYDLTKENKFNSKFPYFYFQDYFDADHNIYLFFSKNVLTSKTSSCSEDTDLYKISLQSNGLIDSGILNNDLLWEFQYSCE